MPALIPTSFEGVVTWLGVVQTALGVLPSQPEAEVFACFAGVAGELHGGLTRGDGLGGTRGYAALGAKVRLHVPDQRVWDYLAQARGVDSFNLEL